jgi:hypothetical protein
VFETEIGEFLNLLGENIAAAPTIPLKIIVHAFKPTR